MTEGETAFQSRALFLFGEPEGFFDAFERVDNADSQLRSSLLAFRSNLGSAILIGNIPYSLTQTAILNERFNRLLTAERIRQLKVVEPHQPLSEKEEVEAGRIARTKMEAELQDSEVIQLHARQTLRFLDEHLNDEASVSQFRNSYGRFW